MSTEKISLNFAFTVLCGIAVPLASAVLLLFKCTKKDKKGAETTKADVASQAQPSQAVKTAAPTEVTQVKSVKSEKTGAKSAAQEPETGGDKTAPTQPVPEKSAAGSVPADDKKQVTEGAADTKSQSKNQSVANTAMIANQPSIQLGTENVKDNTVANEQGVFSKPSMATDDVGKMKSLSLMPETANAKSAKA